MAQTPRVNILQHSTKPTVIGAVPADAGVTETDTDHLLDRTLEPRKTDRRYNAAFWAAFKRPLEPLLRRYLYVEQPHHFRDTDDEGTVGPGYTEIERSFIASTGADDTTIEESIRGWLESKGMEAEAFYRVERETTLPHDDLLGRLLTALDAEDLSRMTKQGKGSTWVCAHMGGRGPHQAMRPTRSTPIRSALRPKFSLRLRCERTEPDAA